GENRAEDSHPAPGNAASRAAFLRSLRPAPGPHRQTTGEDDIYRSLVPVPARRDKCHADVDGKAAYGIDSDGGPARSQAHGLLRWAVGRGVAARRQRIA